MFFKHFASKNQLHGLSVSGTLLENGLILEIMFKSSKHFDEERETFLDRDKNITLTVNKRIDLDPLRVDFY